MKELGITKGEWTISPDNNWECCILMGDQENHYINLENRDIDGWDEMHANATLIADAGNTAQKCGLLPSELLQQRDELKEALEEQKRLYFNLFDEEISCMYCEAKIRRGSAIILCKECAENTEG